jgi:glyoxylase-like metal-dependent hydrolase (beta-lactamase superfamily II)
MKRAAMLLTVLAACGSKSTPAAPSAPKLTVDVYPATESDVNAYVISDGRGAVVIDATRTSADGAAVAALVKQRTSGPVTVLVTHGHPDHFLGLGALRAALPDARFVVARPEIETDIIGMATWMTEQGWLEQEAAMKPRSDANPAGFDYAAQLDALAEPRLVLPGGAVLELDASYAATEAAHMTTVHSRDLGALFTSDLAYKDVHLWLGIGVTPDAAREWQATLSRLEATWGPSQPTIYPGHGAPTDTSVFAADRAYIDDLLAAAASSASDEAARDAMIAKYPDHKNRDFLLMMSIANQRALAQPAPAAAAAK